MASKIKIEGRMVKPGEKMTKGTGWRLVFTKQKRGARRVFAGTLKGTYNFGKVRVAIFSVPK